MADNFRLENSDKAYWHRYMPFYETAFDDLGAVPALVEFGVFKGASISWLLNRFPDTRITAFDILPLQPEWPIDPRVDYEEVDQSDRAAVRNGLAHVDGEVGLIIEDGSHIPQHQASCLAEGFRRLSPGGLYILEDIHTSHPQHPYVRDAGGMAANALSVLLALEHWASEDRASTAQKSALSTEGYFSSDDIDYLCETVRCVEMYRRATLPMRCYACGGDQYDYIRLKCHCGVDIYDTADSMTALIWKR